MSTLRVRLTPRADRNAIVSFEEGVVLARVTAPPVEGAANAALIQLLSGALGIRKSAIIITGGATSRDKRVEIEGVQQHEIDSRIRAAITTRSAS